MMQLSYFSYRFAHIILASFDDFCLQHVTVVFVKRWFSIFIFPSIVVHWNSAIRKSCTCSPTYSFSYLLTSMSSQIFILFDRLEFIITIIHFVAQSVQVLITMSCSFELASRLFWHHAINFLLLPCCLGLQNSPGSSCTSLAPDLQSTISAGALLTFIRETVFRNQNLGSVCVDFLFAITHLELLLGRLSR